MSKDISEMVDEWLGDSYYENINGNMKLHNEIDLEEIHKNINVAEYEPEQFPAVRIENIFDNEDVVVWAFENGSVNILGADSPEDFENVVNTLEEHLRKCINNLEYEIELDSNSYYEIRKTNYN